MLTEAPPRKNRAEYSESDRIKTLHPPPNGDLPEIARRREKRSRRTARSSAQHGLQDQVLAITAHSFSGVRARVTY
jgi:hypothetical protein